VVDASLKMALGSIDLGDRFVEGKYDHMHHPRNTFEHGVRRSARRGRHTHPISVPGSWWRGQVRAVGASTQLKKLAQSFF
jgi:hypothetical protein